MFKLVMVKARSPWQKNWWGGFAYKEEAEVIMAKGAFSVHQLGIPFKVGTGAGYNYWTIEEELPNPDWGEVAP